MIQLLLIMKIKIKIDKINHEQNYIFNYRAGLI